MSRSALYVHKNAYYEQIKTQHLFLLEKNKHDITLYVHASNRTITVLLV